MRIGIAGAHRVGKTTTAKDVANALGIAYVDADVRGALAKNGIDAKTATTFEQRLVVQNFVLKHCSNEYEKHKNFITDRTPLDFIGYTLSEYIRGVDFAVTEVAMQDYFDRCITATDKYFDVVVFIPPDIRCEDCSTSAENFPMYIEHISSVIYSAFNYHISTTRIIIPKGMTSRSDRANFICNLWSSDEESR